MTYLPLTRRDLTTALLRNDYLENFCRVVIGCGSDSEKLFDYRYRYFALQWQYRRIITKLMFFSGVSTILFGVPLTAMGSPSAAALFFIGTAVLIAAALRVIRDDTRHGDICRIYSKKSAHRLLRDLDQGRIRIFAEFPPEAQEYASRVLGRPVPTTTG
jgi:hypothetical protein